MEKSELGLVDKLIYEAYKDKALYNSDLFKKDVKKNYGYEPSSDLYRIIINYQIKKYGKQVTAEVSKDYIKYFKQYGTRNRKKKNERNVEYQRGVNYLRKIEDEQR